MKKSMKAMISGAGVLAGTFAFAMAVSTLSVSAETNGGLEQITGHGEWKQEGGQWYYYQDGKMLKNCWLRDGIDWFLLNGDGSMKSDELVWIENNLYYFRTWGAMQYNNWYTDSEGSLYYFRDWGAAHNTGWKQIGQDWYYFDQNDCKAHTGTLEKIDNDLFSFAEDGKMLHDCWLTADGGRYYFRDWGAAHNTGWKQIGQDWYYFDQNDCKAHTGTLEKIDSDLFSFAEDGKMLHDCWLTANGKIYYLRDWGAAHNTGWKQIGQDWYYFDPESCAAYADVIVNLEQNIYGFAEDGKMLHDCWKDADGIRYYFRGWGAAYHDQTVTIDGKEYVFDSSCNGSLKEETEEKVKVTEIKIAGNSEMKVGEQQKLTAEVLPENADDKSVRWSAEQPEILLVGEDGTITAQKAGTAVVTAEAGDGSGVKGTFEITVADKPESVSEITVAGEKTMKVGEAQLLKLTVMPENASNAEVTWESDHPEIVSVTQKGKAEAKAAGTAVITATAKDGSGVSGSISITVEQETVEAEEVTITGVQENGTLELRGIGSTAQLGVEILPENVQDQTVTWSVDAPEIVSVDENGLVTALAEGSATVTAQTANGIRDEITVNVTADEAGDASDAAEES